MLSYDLMKNVFDKNKMISQKHLYLKINKIEHFKGILKKTFIFMLSDYLWILKWFII